jgi:hypothetical protein
MTARGAMRRPNEVELPDAASTQMLKPAHAFARGTRCNFRVSRRLGIDQRPTVNARRRENDVPNPAQDFSTPRVHPITASRFGGPRPAGRNLGESPWPLTAAIEHNLRPPLNSTRALARSLVPPWENSSCFHVDPRRGE